MEWIPVNYNEEEEILKGTLPEEGQEILITYRGKVSMDTNLIDEEDGELFYYLDSGLSWEEVTAWMPMPEPYKGE